MSDPRSRVAERCPPGQSGIAPFASSLTPPYPATTARGAPATLAGAPRAAARPAGQACSIGTRFCSGAFSAGTGTRTSRMPFVYFAFTSPGSTPGGTLTVRTSSP